METQPDVVYKKVKAPLSTEEMKEAFLNKGKIKYIIDYKNSSLKTDVLLMFLSNLEIDPEFDLEGVPSKEKFDFIVTYMKSKAKISSVYLALTVAGILLHSRKIDSEQIVPRTMSDAEMDEFIAANKEIVDRWSVFIDSTLLLMIRAFDPQISLEQYEEVQDAQVGVNIVNLLQMSAFYEAFIAAGEGQNLKWFTNQFEEHYFKGVHILNYLQRNPVHVGIDGLANGILTPEIIADVAKELDALEQQ
jgi:hypothetical protein